MAKEVLTEPNQAMVSREAEQKPPQLPIDPGKPTRVAEERNSTFAHLLRQCHSHHLLLSTQEDIGAYLHIRKMEIQKLLV